MLGAVYQLQSDTVITMTNAREFLNYKIELSRLHLLHQLSVKEGDHQDIVLQGCFNTGIILVKLISNRVSCDLSLAFSALHEAEIDPYCTVLLLDTKTKLDNQALEGLTLKSIADKNLAIVLRFKYPILPVFEKRTIGKCNLEGIFKRNSDTVCKKAESSLSLNSARTLKINYKSYCGMYALEIENQFNFPIIIENITIASN